MITEALKRHRGEWKPWNGSKPGSWDRVLTSAKQSPRPMKVLILTSFFKGMGGAEKNMMDLISGFTEKNYACQLAALQSGPLKRHPRLAGVPFHDIQLVKIFSWEALLKGIRFMFFLKREKIDAVITYHHDADVWGGIFSRLAGVRVLISSRRDLGYMLGKKHIWLYRIVNRVFDRIITVSDAVKETVCRREWTPAHKITTVYNGVDLAGDAATVDRASKSRELHLNPDAPVVGMVASFRPVKGQEFFVRAAEKIVKTIPNAQFLIVGDKNTDYFESVDKLIHELGLEKSVFCVGERADIHELIPVFDVFVLPSLQEGFSNALIEAMACGVPPVATSTGGNSEALQHAKTGFLVPPRDVKGLAHAVTRLLMEEPLRRQIALAAKQDAVRRFSAEKMIGDLTRLLSHLYEKQGNHHATQ